MKHSLFFVGNVNCADKITQRYEAVFMRFDFMGSGACKLVSLEYKRKDNHMYNVKIITFIAKVF